MESRTKFEIILNAGAGLDRVSEVVDTVSDYISGKPEWKLSIAQSGRELVQLAEQAAVGSCEIVVAAGGDGTVNAVATAILNTDKKLGVLPVGTLNHFAKDLGLPLDVRSALETIAHGTVAEIDVGSVNGEVFLNNSSLGLYPSIVTERQKQQRLGWRKWPAFMWAALQVLRRYPLLHVNLSVDGESFSGRTPFVFVGNNRYQMKGFRVGERKSLNGGVLSVYMTDRTDRLALVRFAVRALLGGLRYEKDFSIRAARELSIESKRTESSVAADGEVKKLSTPLHYRILPKALRVIVPAEKVNQ